MLTYMMLLAGILSPYNGSAQVSDAPLQPVVAVQSAEYAAMPADNSIHTASIASATESVYEEPDTPDTLSYHTLNGVSLSDSRAELLDKKGEPLRQVKTDAGYTEYEYDDVKVGMMGNHIYYVSVPAHAGSLTLDGHSLRLNKQAITSELGEPDFTAEDGEGYNNDFYAFKVFTKPGTDEIVSADIFDTLSE
ncbi:hypothetical protein AR543_21200 [Paenibacillus bovis]|uniref:Copper amine oxidase-like N-terminal domain-containing protein n=2 Tax=Paenibacillus bovis TaxID=1616788 RepID=A0A172ZLI5_9BACL|nr:hypothetical protein AR543_21200 [Paenibacillus bovis]